MNDECRTCGCLLDDWTPRCPTCRDRHRRRAERSDSKYAMGRYRARAREILLDVITENARRVRDGEIKRPSLWGANAR